MYINKVERVDISLNGMECVDIAIYLKRVVEDNAKNHHLEWYLKRTSTPTEEGFIEYIQAKEQGEAFYLNAIKQFSYVGGSPQFYDDLIYKIKKIFADRPRE